jgi:hypothetical protein
MNKSARWLITLLAIPVLGCSVPQTRTEFKEVSAGSRESYEVNRPYGKVVEILKTKSAECLSTRLRRRQCTGSNCADDIITYTPTIVHAGNKLELSVQVDVPRSMTDLRLYKDPKGGRFIVLADVAPSGKGKTKLDVYAPYWTNKTIPKAVRHWAEGTSLGCPNLAEETPW